jgi:hypothetical protein
MWSNTNAALADGGATGSLTVVVHKGARASARHASVMQRVVMVQALMPDTLQHMLVVLKGNSKHTWLL